MNTWQAKKQQGIILTAKAVYDKMIETMRQEVIRNKEKTIQDLITEEMGVVILDMNQVTKRCHLKVYPDGVEILYWDDQPRILFHAVAMTEVNGKSQIVQQYERLTAENADLLDKYLAVREEPTTEAEGEV
jgi:hypothetical protein